MKFPATLVSTFVLGSALSLALVFSTASAQSGTDADAARLANDAVQKQLAILHADVSYRALIRKSDQHGTVVRDEIDTPTGHVARLLMREGKPLSAAEDAAERERLIAFLNSSREQQKKLKQRNSGQKTAEQLLTAMPKAMIYSFKAGQPQLPDYPAKQIVLDYKPSPQFHPDVMAQEALTGIAGTLWLDAQTHRMVRMEATFTKGVGFILGLVKVYPGGTMNIDQRDFAPGHTAFTNMSMDLSVREALVKRQSFRSNQSATQLQPLPAGTNLQQATQLLIDHPQQTH